MTVHVVPDQTLETLAREALAIQDACNSCGLAQRFALVMRELNGCAESTGTDWVNQHPITRLWLDKFTSLARMPQGLDCVSYEQVEKLARGQDVEIEVM